MNIFVLSLEPKEAAQWHMDRHVVKMPLESAQMLCTALYHHGYSSPYKPAHKNHPCTLWAAKSRSNFIWLCRLGLELCEEYTFRYKKEHKSGEVISFCKDMRILIPDGPLTSFAQAMPDEYKDACPLKAYREYYRKGKSHLASWRDREEPWWYKDDSKKAVLGG